MSSAVYNTISLKITDHLNRILSDLAKREDRSKSSLIRKIIAEYIEDQQDLLVCDEAMKDYDKDSKTYSLEDIKAENDL